MGRDIAIIQSHPDPSRLRVGRALEAAYAQGAGECGHEIRTLDVATLDFPLLRTKSDWETGTAPETIRHAQDVIRWADQLVIFYLLWAGSMPALLKGFIEQTFRPSFAMDPRAGPMGRKRLEGRTARIVVTMGMPALFYRWFYLSPEEPRAQHPGLLRHRPDRGEPHRHGGGGRSGAAPRPSCRSRTRARSRSRRPPPARRRGVHRGRCPPAGSAGGLAGGGAAASRGATSQSRSSGNCASRLRAKSTSGRRDRRTDSRKAFAKRRV